VAANFLHREQTYPLRVASLPGLSAALRTSHSGRSFQVIQIMPHSLVQAYRVAEGDASTEAESAAYVIRHLADRLHRLTRAYAEWSVFDAPAYFDLTTEQAGQLLVIRERMTTVHVAVYADLLLPSFQRVCGFFDRQFAPAYAAIHAGVEQAERFFEQVQPVVIEQWQCAVTAVRAARDLLIADIGYLAVNGAEEERWRWRWAWQQAAAPGVEVELLASLAAIPTLSLSIDFPLPLSRQPGRQRRLRLQRQRHRRRK
jgi:hypothetical protein